MMGMFNNAIKFNQDLSSWKLSNIKTMYAMFYNAENFSINPNWTIRPGTDTSYKFTGTELERYIQPLSKMDQFLLTSDALDKLTEHDPYGLHVETKKDIGQYIDVEGLRRDYTTLNDDTAYLPRGGRRTDRRRTKQRKSTKRRKTRSHQKH